MKTRFKYILSKITLLTSLYLLLILISCATTSGVPEWFNSKESVYPESAYITGLGNGKTKEEAKNNSIAEVSLYLQTNIESLTHTEFKDEVTAKGSEINQKLVQNITISSKTTLSGLLYTQAFYNNKDKNWYCMVFISRKKAWELYQPEVQQAKMNFYAIYNNIPSDNPLEAYKWCNKSQSAADVFFERLMLANIIDPKKENATYNADRRTIAELNVKIQRIKEKITIYIELKNDVLNIVQNALSESLQDLGFKIVNDKKSARYTAKAEIIFNETKTIDEGDMIFTHIPSLNLSIIDIDSGKDIYTYGKQSNKKIVSFIQSDAQKKSVKTLAELIHDNFQVDITTNLKK